MKGNQDIFLIVGDVGYGVFDKFKEDFSERFINPGASEQLMVGMASGLAMDGKIPIVYSITPFIYIGLLNSLEILLIKKTYL